MVCPLCHSAQVIAKAVDGREQYRCRGCSHRWYSQRAHSTRADEILDGIADEVARSGAAEERSIVVAEDIWRSGYRKHLREWCLAHGFVCTKVFRSGRGNGLAEQYLRFT